MSSSSTDPPVRRRVRRLVAAAALALVLCAGASADEERVVVGLLPSEDAAVTAELLRGARLALDGSPTTPRITLRVGRRGERWTTVASEAVRLVTRERALALIGPPDRDRAHLLAQVGTRSRVPIVSTSPSPSVGAAGSKWVLCVLPDDEAASAKRRGPPAAPPFDAASRTAGTVAFRKAFRERHARDPRAWEAVGYDAALLIAGAVRRGGRSRGTLMAELRDGPSPKRAWHPRAAPAAAEAPAGAGAATPR